MQLAIYIRHDPIRIITERGIHPYAAPEGGRPVVQVEDANKLIEMRRHQIESWPTMISSLGKYTFSPVYRSNITCVNKNYSLQDLRSCNYFNTAVTLSSVSDWSSTRYCWGSSSHMTPCSDSAWRRPMSSRHVEQMFENKTWGYVCPYIIGRSSNWRWCERLSQMLTTQSSYFGSEFAGGHG